MSTLRTRVTLNEMSHLFAYILFGREYSILRNFFVRFFGCKISATSMLVRCDGRALCDKEKCNFNANEMRDEEV